MFLMGIGTFWPSRSAPGRGTALGDMVSRGAGKPIASRPGGVPGRIRAHASPMKRDIPPRTRRRVRLCAAQGFSAARWCVDAECSGEVDEWPGRITAIIPVVPHAW
jgi:hypothetical protein